MNGGSARAPALAAFLAAVVLFAPSLTNGFALDDLSIVEGNPALHDLANLPRLLVEPYWPGPDGRELGVWRPLTTATLALAWSAGDGAPWAFHLLNVLVHGVASALVALLAAGLLGTGAAWGAGLFFAVHPVHVEAVANVVGLGELLAGSAVLGACVVLLRSAPGERLGPRRTAAIAGLFAFGLLAKEGAAMLPGLIFVTDAYRERIRIDETVAYLRRRAPLYVALGAVLATVLLVRGALLGSAASTRPPLGAELLGEIPRIWTMAPVWLEYLRLLFWPAVLLPDYGPGVLPVRTTWSLPGVAGAGVVLALLALAFLAFRRGTLDNGSRAAAGLPVAVLWFVVAILPTSNLLFLGGFLLAERALYLPTAGVAVALGCLAATLGRGRGASALRLAGVAALAVLALRSIAYIPVWTHQDTVFGHLAAHAPESGRFLWAQGDRAVEAGLVDAGALTYRRAVPVLGGSYFFLTGSGRRLLRGRRPAHARALLHRATEVWTDHAEAPLLLALLESGEGRWAEAERWARRTVALDGERVEGWHLLAGSLEAQGRWGDAAEARTSLLERGEHRAWQQWSSLAEALARSGARDRASAALDSAEARGAEPAAVSRIREVLDSLAAERAALQTTGILQNPRRR